MVSKVVTKGGVPHAFFIDGSYDEVSTQIISFNKGISKGDYLITFSGDFT
jgi:hypothetical protein